MKFKNPSKQYQRDITNCLEKTLPNRRKWILDKKPSVAEIYNTYPRLWDYHGQMVNIQTFNRDFLSC